MLNSQSKAASILALALCRSTAFLFAADAPQDPLWRKAVAVADANADWVPGLVISRIEALHKGESRTPDTEGREIVRFSVPQASRMA